MVLSHHRTLLCQIVTSVSLLFSPHVAIHCLNTLSPATLKPLAEEGELQDYITYVGELLVLPSDVVETTSENSDLILFVDKSDLKQKLKVIK